MRSQNSRFSLILTHPQSNVWIGDRNQTTQRREALQGFLHYRQVDVQNVAQIEQAMDSTASSKNRLDGTIAAAGIPQVGDAMHQDLKGAHKAMEINFWGVFNTATAAAKQMYKYKSRGSIVLVASMACCHQFIMHQKARWFSWEGTWQWNGEEWTKRDVAGYELTPFVQDTF